MKSPLLKLVLGVFSIIMLMTSCLGDGDSSVKRDRDFAYVTYDEATGAKYAVTSVGYLKHSEINKLEAGRCYWIGYKILLNGTGGTYQAEYVNVLDNGYPIPQKSLVDGAPYYGIDPSTVESDSINATSISISAFAPTKYIGDSWLFTFSVPALKEKEGVNAYFYYDRNNQRDENGAIIGSGATSDDAKNRVVIDVVFLKTDTDPENTPTLPRTVNAIGNLSELRYLFNPKYTGAETTADVAIKFRYVVPATSTTVPATTKYIGAWSGTNVYYMTFGS